MSNLSIKLYTPRRFLLYHFEFVIIVSCVFFYGWLLGFNVFVGFFRRGVYGSIYFDMLNSNYWTFCGSRIEKGKFFSCRRD